MTWAVWHDKKLFTVRNSIKENFLTRRENSVPLLVLASFKQRRIVKIDVVILRLNYWVTGIMHTAVEEYNRRRCISESELPGQNNIHELLRTQFMLRVWRSRILLNCCWLIIISLWSCCHDIDGWETNFFRKRLWDHGKSRTSTSQFPYLRWYRRDV